MGAMEPYQVLLLILVLAAFVYVSLVVYVVGHMIEFSRRLRRRLRGLNLLLYERATAVLEMVDEFKKKDVPLSEEDTALFRSLRALRFDKVSEESFRQALDQIKEATSRIKYLAQNNPEVAKGAIFQEEADLLEDLERNYRVVIGQYNMDIIAYNYWITIPLIGWIGFLLGYRKRNSLS